MALDAAHARLERRSGADLRDRIRARTIVMQRTFTGFTGTPVPGGQVDLVYPDNPSDYDTPGTVGTSRTPNWATARTMASELTSLKIERNTSDVATLPYADIQSSPFDQVQAANQKIAHKLAVTIDDDLADALIAGVPAAAKHTPAVLGDANNFIAADGTITQEAAKAAQAYIVDAFKGAYKWMLADSLIGGGERDYEVWALCPGPLWGTWIDYIEDVKPTDALFNAFVGPGSGSVADVPQSMRIRVYIYNRMPTAEVSSKAHAQILFGTDRAMVFGAAPPVMGAVPVSHVVAGSAIGATYGMAQWWGRVVLNPEQLRIARIRQEA